MPVVFGKFDAEVPRDALPGEGTCFGAASCQL